MTYDDLVIVILLGIIIQNFAVLMMLRGRR
jgi:hypothetical protein